MGWSDGGWTRASGFVGFRHDLAHQDRLASLPDAADTCLKAGSSCNQILVNKGFLRSSEYSPKFGFPGCAILLIFFKSLRLCMFVNPALFRSGVTR